MDRQRFAPVIWAPLLFALLGCGPSRSGTELTVQASPLKRGFPPAEETRKELAMWLDLERGDRGEVVARSEKEFLVRIPGKHADRLPEIKKWLSVNTRLTFHAIAAKDLQVKFQKDGGMPEGYLPLDKEKDSLRVFFLGHDPFKDPDTLWVDDWTTAPRDENTLRGRIVVDPKDPNALVFVPQEDPSKPSKEGPADPQFSGFTFSNVVTLPAAPLGGFIIPKDKSKEWPKGKDYTHLIGEKILVKKEPFASGEDMIRGRLDVRGVKYLGMAFPSPGGPTASLKPSRQMAWTLPFSVEPDALHAFSNALGELMKESPLGLIAMVGDGKVRGVLVVCEEIPGGKGELFTFENESHASDVFTWIRMSRVPSFKIVSESSAEW